MLQCIRTVQEAYSSQSVEVSVSYVKVKSAVLKGFQTCSGVISVSGLGKDVMARLVLNMFNFIRWLNALDFTALGDLCELRIFESYCNALPSLVATFIDEKSASIAIEAAVSADEFGLLIRYVPCAGKRFRFCFKLIQSVQGKLVRLSRSPILVVSLIKAKTVTIVMKRGDGRLIVVFYRP